MKIKRKWALATITAVAIALAISISLFSSGAEATQAHEQAIFNVTDVTPFPTGDPLAGASTLTRMADGVSMTFETSGLQDGAYSVWWVIYNDPDDCSDADCNLDDVLPPPGNSAAKVSVLWATGGMVGDDGVGSFRASLDANSPLGQVAWGVEQGLMNPRDAVIHLVLQSHGPAVPGSVGEQITRFNGGCPGPGLVNAPCGNVQAAVHLPYKSFE